MQAWLDQDKNDKDMTVFFRGAAGVEKMVGSKM